MADPLEALMAMAGKQLAGVAPNPTTPFDELIRKIQPQQDEAAEAMGGLNMDQLYSLFANPMPKPNFASQAFMGSMFKGGGFANGMPAAPAMPQQVITPRAAGPVGQSASAASVAPSTPNIPASNPNVKAPLGHLNWISPIKGMPVHGLNLSQGADFGPRVHPVHGGYSNHTGIDFGASAGTIIRAPANARVYAVNLGDSVYGNQIILRHGKGYQTMYGHLSSTAVEPGQKVKRGQPIGAVGSTGLSTGPHLHFETWYKRKPVDPMMIM